MFVFADLRLPLAKQVSNNKIGSLAPLPKKKGNAQTGLEPAALEDRLAFECIAD